MVSSFLRKRTIFTRSSSSRGPEMMVWCTGLPTLAALLLLVVPSCVNSAPVIEQNTEMDSYYPVADSTGCYYNFQHYDEGDRIITNEPCLNCTCHNRMLMCYLRVCPFIKAIGENCKVEKRADQCCPIITCPEVPVQLLTSTTTESTGASSEVGHLDTYGCSIDKLFYSDGARVPSDPNKPCELCYCIRNKTACVMQECTLQIDGCKPVYQDGVCCPVRYDCEHPEYTEPETTVIPTTTTTLRTIFTTLPAATPADCIHEGEIYADGALIKKDLCDHCYCMKGDIVCAVQECGPTPLDKVNCTALPVKEGQCCPDTYDCENISEEELTTTYYELTTQAAIKAAEEEQAIKHEMITETPVESPTEVPEEAPHESQTPETLEERKPMLHPDEAITSAQATTEPVEENQTEVIEEMPKETVVPDHKEQLPESITEQDTLSNEIDFDKGHKPVQHETITESLHTDSPLEEPLATIKSVEEEPQKASEESLVPITERVVTSRPIYDCGDDPNCTLQHAPEKETGNVAETLQHAPEKETGNVAETETASPEVPKTSDETPNEPKKEQSIVPEVTEPNNETEQPAIYHKLPEDEEQLHIDTTDVETEEPEFMERTVVPKAEVAPTTAHPYKEEESEKPILSHIPEESESASTAKEETLTESPVTEPVQPHEEQPSEKEEDIAPVTEVAQEHSQSPNTEVIEEDLSSIPEKHPEELPEAETEQPEEHTEVIEEDLSSIPEKHPEELPEAETEQPEEHVTEKQTHETPVITEAPQQVSDETSSSEQATKLETKPEAVEAVTEREEVATKKPEPSETHVPHEEEPEVPLEDDIDNEDVDHEEESPLHEE
ncbi:hypothetical protein QE152_g15724 [Popillia japonica]|uniref:VWFC domain-containing protein n=1 Tax=Popillia japonica TaxID=7064 RepID=A0AAW1L741_POPJA